MDKTFDAVATVADVQLFNSLAQKARTYLTNTADVETADSIEAIIKVGLDMIEDGFSPKEQTRELLNFLATTPAQLCAYRAFVENSRRA